MRHEDITISSIGELVVALRDTCDATKPTWFRGQSKIAWSLKPSLARKKKLEKAEANLIKRFKQNALPHLQQRPLTEWEWMFLMQHYRLPTRLLDWSESPLAALYFSVIDQRKSDGALWCLDPIALNQNANIRFELDVEIPAFDHDDILNSYLPSSIARETSSELNPIAATALRNSPRIAAQLGTFTITHRAHRSIEDLADANHVWRFQIPATAKGSLMQELSLLRITELTLFPELDSVANNAKEGT